MTFNSEEIIRDIRAEFDQMLVFVTGEAAHSATAYQIERGLFKQLLAIGAKLLRLFFAVRAQACSHPTLELADGQVLPLHSEKARSYFSIFGKLSFARPYFYRKGLEGQSPLDAELSLGADCYSDLLREVAAYLGVDVAYNRATGTLAYLLGLDLSSRVLQEVVAADATDVEAYYAQKPAPAPATEAEILVIQADGKGVPIVRETAAEPTASCTVQ